MAAVKEQSTIQANKRIAQAECPVTYVMEKIGGYWKPIILYHLAAGDKRYSDPRHHGKNADPASQATGAGQPRDPRGTAGGAPLCHLPAHRCGTWIATGDPRHGRMGL